MRAHVSYCPSLFCRHSSILLIGECPDCPRSFPDASFCDDLAQAVAEHVPVADLLVSGLVKAETRRKLRETADSSAMRLSQPARALPQLPAGEHRPLEPMHLMRLNHGTSPARHRSSTEHATEPAAAQGTDLSTACLAEMGFSPVEAAAALSDCGGDLASAVQQLLGEHREAASRGADSMLCSGEAAGGGQMACGYGTGRAHLLGC